MDRDLRSATLLRGAVAVAERLGLVGLTHRAVAAECRVSPRTVYRWANDRNHLRARVIEHATRCGLIKVLAEASELRLN